MNGPVTVALVCPACSERLRGSSGDAGWSGLGPHVQRAVVLEEFCLSGQSGWGKGRPRGGQAKVGEYLQRHRLVRDGRDDGHRTEAFGANENVDGKDSAQELVPGQDLSARPARAGAGLFGLAVSGDTGARGVAGPVAWV